MSHEPKESEITDGIAQTDDLRANDSAKTFPVVAIGASAGGLESLERLFDNFPTHSGIAFVVIQHLSPDFESVMDQLLSRRTSVCVEQAEDDLDLHPDTIYLIPPKQEATVSAGRFRLKDKGVRTSPSLSIDSFFSSLAVDSGKRAVAVILSGSGSDGARGIKDIHDAGGLVISESSSSARFNGMPQAAQQTGLVDFVLPSSKIAEAILEHAADPATRFGPVDTDQEHEQGFALIFALLNREFGINFSDYKSGTVGRRVQRRIKSLALDSVEAYADHLQSHSVERELLYQDLLIGVTQFFRDPDAFVALQEKVLPKILERVGPNEEIRVWVAACATGEEAYSIAMLFHELLESRGRPINVKVFATDVHQESLSTAGVGRYEAAALSKVTPKRLTRYFRETQEGYVVAPEIRSLVVFAPHNVLKNAPFTRLDLVSCRNLLIYFQPEVQQKVISLFHFGLKTDAVLMLGPSETLGPLQSEFDSIDTHWRMYSKLRDVRLPLGLPLSGRTPATPLVNTVGASPVRPTSGLVAAYDWMLDRHMPPAILIDENHQLLHTIGSASQFLKIRGGRPSTDCLDLFEGDLRTAVFGALQQLKIHRRSVAYSGVPVNSDGEIKKFRIQLEPVENELAKTPQILITFHEEQQVDVAGASSAADDVEYLGLSQNRIDSLEHELTYTRESLQGTVEELEASNEELQATNEEMIASNEELQSTNEELQSVNEELYSVNAEYQKKIRELVEMTADLDALMDSTDVATIFLDRELCIRKFTPEMARMFRLMPQDIGRSIEGFVHHIREPRIVEGLRRVRDFGDIIENEIQIGNDRWMLMRLLPYRFREEGDGVLLTLMDVDSLKRAQDKLASALSDRERFLAMLSHEMRNPINAVMSASHLLRAQAEASGTEDTAVDVIARQAGHLVRLLDDLLDVSRMTQQKLELRKVQLDLRGVITDALESVQPDLSEHEQHVEVTIPDTAMPVFGDPHRLRQVFVNLLANASKYAPSAGSIELTASTDGVTAHVAVVDHGDGIEASMLETLFDPFVQSARTSEHREGGMGVGLALVKYVVENHNGSISVSSEGPEQGSRFSVTLPLLQDSAEEDLDGEGVPEPGTNLLPERSHPSARVAADTIVIIEDDIDNRQMLTALLKMEGFQVSAAEDAVEGIRMINEQRPDVALVDLHMPSLDGFEVARRIRSTLGDNIQVYALTGHGAAEDVEASQAAGFDAHFVKPIDIDRLLQMLRPS